MGRLKIGIVGAGSAGLFTAWYLKQLDPEVEIHVFDAQGVGAGATFAAAGMLAPSNEIEFQEVELFRAEMASLKLYHQEILPVFKDIGLGGPGTLELPLFPADAGLIRRLYEFQVAQGVDVQMLTRAELLDLEPLLSSDVQLGIYSRMDTQVDQKKLFGQMATALQEMGVQFHMPCRISHWAQTEKAAEVQWEGGSMQLDRVLLSVGAVDSATSAKLPFTIQPIRGETVILKPHPQFNLQTVVRIRSVSHGSAYAVPKEDRIILGSNAEERGFVLGNTAGGVMDILRKCHHVLPGLFELEFERVNSGLRPATLDRQPVLDQTGNIFYLNGLYRHGILLGPLFGKSAARMLLGQAKLPETVGFEIKRPQTAAFS